MSTYIVNQNNCFNEERQLGALRAIKYNKSGRTDYHHSIIKELIPGDKILHRVRGQIVAVSIVEARYEEFNWDVDGRHRPAWRVKTKYTLLDQPLIMSSYLEEIKSMKSNFQSAFTKNGTAMQGYLFNLNQKLADYLLSEINRING